ncbi:MAG: hypothetical protein L0241_13470 [Planctomycetia bacterium]|nr:hypothetical protein [Planctomycetia bacterium]
MMPLTLVALCAIGVDPQPQAYPYPSSPPYCPLVVAEKRLPSVLRPAERMRAKVADLALVGAGKPEPCGSFLWQPAFAEDDILRAPTRPYTPQPGDIVMSADGSVFWLLMHNLAGTSHPTHSMIVFAMPDGRMGIVEAGPHDTLKCRVLEALPHMLTYEAEGRVWVRRRAVPLTPEESARLTEFALTVDERRFALVRLAGQLTPFRTRGPIRTAFVGKPQGIGRSNYYCSELIVEACVYAGLMNPCTARPGATYPRDLFFDSSHNPYLKKHLKLAPAWDPPARWTSWTPAE